MTIRTSNTNASTYATDRTPFKGNNTFGEIEGNKYVVYSYGYHFPLFIYKNNIWYENKDKYSVSTSKQQTQLRPNTDNGFVLKTTEEMKAL